MTHAAQSHFDSARAQGFAERLLRALNDAALCLMVSIGHRSGLFDAMSRMPPATANDIAVEAGLHERYVREWLGAMVTAGVAEYNVETARYRLPAEHAAALTRAAGADNMAVLPSTSARWAASKMMYWNASSEAAALRTTNFHDSTR
jgi:hypothetical protein